MKFTNYKNCMQATTGMIQEDWGLQRVVFDMESGVTTINLYHKALELKYIIEHHLKKETFEASTLPPFVRGRMSGTQIYYEREHALSDADSTFVQED